MLKDQNRLVQASHYNHSSSPIKLFVEHNNRAPNHSRGTQNNGHSGGQGGGRNYHGGGRGGWSNRGHGWSHGGICLSFSLEDGEALCLGSRDSLINEVFFKRLHLLHL